MRDVNDSREVFIGTVGVSALHSSHNVRVTFIWTDSLQEQLSSDPGCDDWISDVLESTDSVEKFCKTNKKQTKKQVIKNQLPILDTDTAVK